jgi:hypothetical protein
MSNATKEAQFSVLEDPKSLKTISGLSIVYSFKIFPSSNSIVAAFPVPLHISMLPEPDDVQCLPFPDAQKFVDDASNSTLLKNKPSLKVFAQTTSVLKQEVAHPQGTQMLQELQGTINGSTPSTQRELPPAAP